MSQTEHATGKLYIVGTPIGNLEDITMRAVRILSEADLVAAEDTRHTLNLLNHLEITKPLFSYHEHNKYRAGEELVRRMLSGTVVALVTDAGMPCLSDPGWEVVDAAMEADIPVEVVPGPSASIAAVARSGLNCRRFRFEGFLPASGKDRRERLKALERETDTVIFFEAPHRLLKTLEDFAGIWPERRVAVCHDLTKRFESVERGTPDALRTRFAEREIKGEFVLVVEEGEAAVQEETADPEALLRHLLSEGLSVRDAAAEAAAQTGLPKKKLYQKALEIQEDD